MGSRGDHGGGGGGRGAARATQLKVLVPSSFRKMRICDELAAQLGVGVGGGGAPRAATARVASPLGKAWDVGVVRDGDGRAFLGRGWAEFAAAHGLGVGWFVVLRHGGGGGVLAVEAFDTTCCLRVFGAPPAEAGRATDTSRKPQFLTVLLPGIMDKMRIPDKFVRDYITGENLNSNMAIILSPLGKSWRVELDKDQSGVFLGGGWLQFLSFHGISRGDVVIFRYEGNLVFKISVFGPNGRQKDFKAKGISIHQGTGEQQEAPSFSRRKCNNKKKSRFGEDDGNQQEMPCSRKGSGNKGRTSDRETKRMRKTRSVYEIGPRSWIKKEINEYVLERCILSLARTFCESIGLAEESSIKLMMVDTTSTQGDQGGSSSSSSRSWEVTGRRYKDACYLLGAGWRRFCEDNGVRSGDVCVFTVLDTTLWRVDIERC
uniref:TF-B3 domain-containing protein n=1 Tax=Oryza nivara TaxID=4536 RepID=A0A0E0GZC2_ORYNI